MTEETGQAAQGGKQGGGSDHDEENLNDMLQELRILQHGVQVLTAFLVILPFSPGFERLEQLERWVYLATFVCSVSTLVLFSAPAAQHRLERPLMDRARFKDISTRMIIVGLVPFSLALILVSQLVISEAIGRAESLIVAGTVAVLIALLWWIMPLIHKDREQR